MSTKRKAGNGEGSIRRDKNGRYVVELSIGRRPDGTRRRIRRTAATLAEAKKLRTTLLAQQQSGTLVEHSAYTLRSFGLMWSREIKTQTVRATTAADYEYRLRQYVFPYLGSVRLVDLTPQHVQRWMNLLVDAKRGPNTINGARRILYGLCKYAERQGLIGRNPVAATDPIHRRNGTTQVREPWTREETAKVLKAAVDNDDLDCFLHLMLHCGLRPGEALALRWSDIDEERQQLWVRGTLKQARYILPDGTGIVRLQRNAPKTKHSERPLAISETVASALERQRARQQQMQETPGAVWRRVLGEDYIIATRKGTPVDASNLRPKFQKFLASIGTRYVRLHDLRHTTARLALEAELPLATVSQALGHTRLDTTLQVYAGRVPRYSKDFANAMSNVLPETAQEPIPDTVEQLLRAFDDHRSIQS